MYYDYMPQNLWYFGENNTLLILIDAYLFCLHYCAWSCTQIPCGWSTLNGLFWRTVLQTHASVGTIVSTSHDYLMGSPYEHTLLESSQLMQKRIGPFALQASERKEGILHKLAKSLQGTVPNLQKKSFPQRLFFKVMLQELSWRYHWPKGHFFWMSWEPKEMTPGFEILLFPLWKISVQLKLTILAGREPNFMGTQIRKFYGQNSHWTNCFQFKDSNFLIKLQCLTLFFFFFLLGWMTCPLLDARCSSSCDLCSALRIACKAFANFHSYVRAKPRKIVGTGSGDVSHLQ